VRRQRDGLANDPEQQLAVAAQIAALYKQLDLLFNRQR